MRRTALLLLFLLTATAVRAQAPPEGTWAGTLEVQGTELRLRVHFTRTGAALRATIDIPQQAAAGIPLQNVRYQAPKLHFELAAGPGLAVFDGTRQDDGSFAGTFTQAGVTGTFRLAPAPDEDR